MVQGSLLNTRSFITQLRNSTEWSLGLNWFDLEVEVDERKHKTLQILQPKTLGGNKLGIHLIYRAQQNNKAFISSRTTKFSYKFKPNSQE